MARDAGSGPPANLRDRSGHALQGSRDNGVNGMVSARQLFAENGSYG